MAQIVGIPEVFERAFEAPFIEGLLAQTKQIARLLIIDRGSLGARLGLRVCSSRRQQQATH
jgi:hypothetical protein